MPANPNENLKSIDEELDEIDAFFDEDDEKLQERVDYEMARLRAMGIIDEKGDLIDSELPPDMQEGSLCDLE